jgi:predicted DNA-binding transcriptional regulator AlpA
MKYMTAPKVYKRLGLSRFQLDLRIRRGILPEPTFTADSGVRFFDEEWVEKAQDILNNAAGAKAG